MQYLVKMLDFKKKYFQIFIMATVFNIFQKNMQYFYFKKPIKSNGASFIALTWLELEILYFKDGFLPIFSINFKSGPFIKVIYGHSSYSV